VLPINPGDTVADIGAGGGYFSYRFSRAVGENGRVYAVDIGGKLLEFIQRESEKQGLKNITTIMANENDSKLPSASCNLIFIRDAYHHISDRAEYFRNLSRALRVDGKIAVVDYNGAGFAQKVFRHFTSAETILDEMREAGYILKERFDFLPKQSFFIFESGK